MPGVQNHNGYMVDGRERATAVQPRVRHLVLHYTAGDFESSFATLSRGKVSSHYLLPQALTAGHPIVFQLVPEDQTAHHAGISFWQGRTNINDTSVGIEIVNRGAQGAGDAVPWQAFTPFQIMLLKELGRDIVERYGIAPHRVVGHSDIAPDRKDDPGPLFPWKALAEAGIGAWPDSDTVAYHLAQREPGELVADIGSLQTRLRRYGYDAPVTGRQDLKTTEILMAFQMHFRPSDYRGIADAETDAILDALLEKYQMP